MYNNDLYTSLEKAILLSKSSKLQKVIKSPIKMFYSEILKHFKKAIITTSKTFWDEKMFVVIPEFVSINIYRYGFFEEGLTRIVMEYLKPGMNFFDIGTHFGYFTLLGSYLVGKQGQVHSFEPTPSTFKILEKNATAKSNIFLNNLAVFSEQKIISLNDYGVQYSAYNSIYSARLPQTAIQNIQVKTHNIEAISIDEYASKKGIIPNFIKIDAESSEYEIIIGMERTIKKYHPIISIEVCDLGFEVIHTSKKLISYLENKDYKPYEFKEGKILQHIPKNDQYKYENILFLPK